MQDFTFKMIDNETYAVMSYSGDEKEVTVPSEYLERPVTILFDDIFKGHTEIEKVNIPDTVTDIGGFVFDGCVNLKEIKLPAMLQNMWQYAFVRSSIEKIDIPAGVKYIIPFTFKDCKDLKEVTIHEGTIGIRALAFQNCTGLRKVTAPSDIVIDKDAFNGCTELIINK